MTLRRRKPPKMGCNTAPQVRCPGHLSWLRGHECAVSDTAGSCFGRIEAAHVRAGTDGGTSVKPGDNWAIPLCSYHHAEQHRAGERTFEANYKIDMKKIAADLWGMSPHGKRHRARMMVG